MTARLDGGSVDPLKFELPPGAKLINPATAKLSNPLPTGTSEAAASETIKTGSVIRSIGKAILTAILAVPTTILAAKFWAPLAIAGGVVFCLGCISRSSDIKKAGLTMVMGPLGVLYQAGKLTTKFIAEAGERHDANKAEEDTKRVVEEREQRRAADAERMQRRGGQAEGQIRIGAPTERSSGDGTVGDVASAFALADLFLRF